MIEENILKKVHEVAEKGDLLASARENIERWLKAEFLPQWALDSIQELIEKKAWGELNDRFYQALSFGTGGMRSRTIGKLVTKVEQGIASKDGSPEHAAVGTAMLNDFNIIRATIGLYRYCKKNLEKGEIPKLVIAHDVRHFSRHFCLLAASTWRKLGGEVDIFDGPRSTPQLSFSVRYLRATAGIVITASHNPPCDNGFKVYYTDGGQVVPPHAEGILDQINEVALSDIPSYLGIDQKGINILGKSADEAYTEVVLDTILDRELIKVQKPKIVYTPLHGTGQVIAVPAMQRCGVELSVVKEQMIMDPLFGTVNSPNPENGEAFSMGIKKAQAENADVVIATDPDGDRMGVAIRGRNGEMVLLNGNIIGSLLAEYRISKIKKLGWIPETGTHSAVLIKSFVTTNLQAAIATKHGLKVINTLTGFKWIGAKLESYELELVEKLKAKGQDLVYNELSSEERRKLLLKYSTYYVFGGEESYGYLADDRVRDKDANAASVQFCELAAYLKEQNISFLDYLDQIYLKYDYYSEEILNLKYDGAAGAAKIKAILKSYREDPPKMIGNIAVSSIEDFGRDEIFDADNKKMPKEEFYFVYLKNGYSYAVRASGTEPKIKFYFFGHERVSSNQSLQEIKKLAQTKLEQLKHDLENDAQSRIE